MKKIIFILSIIVSLNAGVYTQNLSKCFIDSTTKQERILLAKWMFVIFSQYPGLKNLSKTTPQTVESYNKKVADLITNLITQKCKKEAKLVLMHEPQNISQSFEVLGRISVNEIINNPNVKKALFGYLPYMNIPKIILELNQ